MTSAPPNTLARALRGFLSDYLPRIRGMSPHTVLSYRDAFLLLLRFLAGRLECEVVALDLADIAPDDVLTFLDHLETDRHNGAATRNTRLAAIHAFARYTASNHPEHLELCQRLLALPFKRARLRVVEYLESNEIAAILSAPDRTTSDGRRDYTLLLALFNTGARVQEILDLRPCDIQLVRPYQVRLVGKGARNVSARSGLTPSMRSERFSPNAESIRQPPSRCSGTIEASHSPVSECATSSESTLNAPVPR